MAGAGNERVQAGVCAARFDSARFDDAVRGRDTLRRPIPASARYSTNVAIDTRPNLAATIAPLAAGEAALGIREALAWISSLGYRGVQLNAADPATRPRDLGPSARRDLAATLARHELCCAGIDLFVPPAHFLDPAHQSRALDAVLSAIGLAADLGRAPVTAPLPDEPQSERAAASTSGIRQAIAAEAARVGVAVLLTAPVPAGSVASSPAPIEPPFRAFLDCAAVLAAQGSPELEIARLGAALGAVRVVDLLRSGLRGPILEPRESRLDALAVRMACEIAPAARDGRPIAIVDARQWTDPRGGIERSIVRWRALGT